MIAVAIALAVLEDAGLADRLADEIARRTAEPPAQAALRIARNHHEGYHVGAIFSLCNAPSCTAARVAYARETEAIISKQY